MNEPENDEEKPDMNAIIRRTVARRQRGIIRGHERLARALGLKPEPDTEEERRDSR